MGQQLNTKKGQLKSKEFAQGSMAMCALIAAADGSIDAAEKQKTTALIASNEVLSIFDARDLQEIFDKYAGQAPVRLRARQGRGDPGASAGSRASRIRRARTIQIGIIIGGADGSFDAHEQQAVREACNAVGIAPGEFDL